MDTAELLRRCMTIGTSTWSDALDQCGISGVVRGLVQRSGRGRFAGFAVTARERAGALGSYPRAEFGVGKMIAAIEPGNVLMADVGGADVSTFGGLAALATQKRAAGVVIDGGCRDSRPACGWQAAPLPRPRARRGSSWKPWVRR